MAEKPPKDKDRDEPVRIPLDPVEALRGLLAVDPESAPAEAERTERTPADPDA